MSVCKVGDRIELTAMPNDPCPIEAGTQGTVTDVNHVNWPGREFDQIDVAWDNGRSLSLVVPPDRLKVL